MRKQVWVGVLGAIVALGLVALLIATNRTASQKGVGIQKPIIIGAILPLTGDAAAYGKAAQKGIDLAIERDRADHPNLPSITVVYEDTQADPKTGVSGFKKLVDIDKVKVVIGSMESSTTLAVAPAAERSRIVLISPASSAPEITNAGDYIFRTAYSDVYEGAVLAKYAVSELKLKSFAILYVDNAYGQGIQARFRETVEALGAHVIAQQKFAQGETDFRTELTKIAASHPDALLLFGYKELGRILVQARQLEMKATILSSVMFEDPDILKVAGAAADGVYYSYPAYNPDGQEAAVKAFVDAYRMKYGGKPDIYAALAYDAAALVAEAIRKNGNDADGIKRFLYAVHDYDGVTGLTSFDANGDVVKDLGIKTVHDGAFTWVSGRYK